MLFDYEPLSDEEIESHRKRLKPGSGTFNVIEAKDRVSKNGNPMIELKLQVWDENGCEGTVFDYLVAGIPSMAFKLRNFCKSIGHPEFYMQRKLSSLTALNKMGKLKITLKKDDKGEEWPRIADYLPHIQGSPLPNYVETKNEIENIDDDIPF